MNKKQELRTLLEKSEYAELFDGLKKLGLNSHQYNILRREFILNRYDIEFEDRLKVLIEEYEEHIIDEKEANFWNLYTLHGSLEFYRTYLEDFPNGKYGVIAETKIKQLKSEKFANNENFEVSWSPITLKKEDEATYNVKKFDDFEELIKIMYSKIKNVHGIKKNSYGETWIIIDSETGKIFKHIRNSTTIRLGSKIDDNRFLEEVGIKGGMKLQAVQLNSEQGGFILLLSIGFGVAIPLALLSYYIKLHQDYIDNNKEGYYKNQVEKTLKELNKIKSELEASNQKLSLKNKKPYFKTKPRAIIQPLPIIITIFCLIAIPILTFIFIDRDKDNLDNCNKELIEVANKSIKNEDYQTALVLFDFIIKKGDSDTTDIINTRDSILALNEMKDTITLETNIVSLVEYEKCKKSKILINKENLSLKKEINILKEEIAVKYGLHRVVDREQLIFNLEVSKESNMWLNNRNNTTLFNFLQNIVELKPKTKISVESFYTNNLDKVIVSQRNAELNAHLTIMGITNITFVITKAQTQKVVISIPVSNITSSKYANTP